MRGAFHLDVNNREQMLRAHRYGTEDYFRIVRRLMEKAGEEGLLLELTAGSGYPLGDTQVNPEQDGMRAMIAGAMYVQGGGTRELSLISPQTAFNTLLGPERSSSYISGGMVVWSIDWPRMRRNLKLRHVVIAQGERADGKMSQNPAAPVRLYPDSMKDVTGYLIDGVLRYCFPDVDWYVFPIFEGPSYQRVKTDSHITPDQESYVLDHFSSGRIKPYLDRHIGRGRLEKYAGTPFRAFFIDSFELVGPYFWSEAFLTEFRNRRGYDLTPFLPLLMTRERVTDSEGRAISCFDLPGDAGERIRRDYDLTIAELFAAYMLKQAKEWGDEHGIKSRVQCYGHAMDPLLAAGACDIPETEQLASAGLLDFLKIPSSAAMLYGKPLVTAEALVWPGCDYMETPRRFLCGSAKLTSAGIGQLYYHGMPYLHDACPWPGYYAWHNSFGSFMNRNSLLWPYIDRINRGIARNQYMTQEGRRRCRIGLYFGGLRSEMPYNGPEYREELSDGELPGLDRKEQYAHLRFDNHCDRWQYVAALTRKVGMRLAEGGFDYCQINAERLTSAELIEGRLTVGDAQLDILILPPVDFINVAAAERIAELVEAGFPVIAVDRLPTHAFGYKDFRKCDALVQASLARVAVVSRNGLPEYLRRLNVMPNVDFMGNQGFDAVQRAFTLIAWKWENALLRRMR